MTSFSQPPTGPSAPETRPDQPPEGGGAPTYSRGFHVYNLSSNSIQLTWIAGPGSFEGRPADGAILSPGSGYHDWEVTYAWPSNPIDTAHYSILGETGDPNEPIGEFSVHMQVYSGGSVSCYGDTTMGTCTPSGWTDGQSTVTLLDPPGTVHDIPAGQGQAQAAVLKQLAADDNLATGKFTVTKEEHIDSPSHPVGHALINNTDVDQDTTLTVTDAVGTEDSVDVSITGGGKLFDIIDLEIEAKYGHTWTTEHTFSQAVQVHVEPHSKAWVMAVEPLIRNTGDFTLELGNTTWILRDVYFDSPDPDGQGSYSVNDAPLTSEERANLPHKFFSTGAV